MSVTKRAGGALLAVTVGAAVYGSAASLGGLNGRGLGAGSARVGTCDGDGVTLAYNVDDDNEIESVTVSGIASACATSTLSLTLTGAGNVTIATGGPMVVGLTSHSVALSPQPNASTVTGAHVLIVGQ